jgi:secreted PhoX family phosphatase
LLRKEYKNTQEQTLKLLIHMKRRDFIKGSMASAAILAMPYGIEAAEKAEKADK